MASCEKHPFEESAGMCARCAYTYCRNCLVHSRGASKPPHCIPCALVLSGVKTGGGPVPRLGKRELKAELKAMRRAGDAEAPVESQRTGMPKMPELDWAALERAEAAFHASVPKSASNNLAT